MALLQDSPPVLEGMPDQYWRERLSSHQSTGSHAKLTMAAQPPLIRHTTKTKDNRRYQTLDQEKASCKQQMD